MQNRDYHEFEPEFIDNSWEKMRQQLDAEMPPKRKRRAGLWWWWMGLTAGVMLGVGIMWWLVPTKMTELDSLPIPQREQIIQNTPIANRSTQTKQQYDNLDAIRPKTTIASVDDQQSNGKEYANKEQFAADSAIGAINRNQETLVQNKTINESQVADNELITVGDVNDEKTFEKTTFSEETRLDNTILTETIETREKFSNIPYLHIPELESLNIPASDVALPHYPSGQRNRLRLGVQVATSTNQEFSQMGYALGVGAEWQFKPKWSLDAALQYANRPIADLNVLVNSEKVQVEVVDDDVPIIAGGGEDEEIDEEDTSTSGTGDPEVDNTNTFEVTDTTYYAPLANNRYAFIELPIALQYRISPRWSVGIGARLGYRLVLDLSNNNIEEFSAADPQTAVTEIMDDNLSYTTNSFYGLPDLARWRIAPTFALQYRLNPQLQLRGQYSNYQWTRTTNQQESLNQRGADPFDSFNIPKRTYEWELQLRYSF
ncbi:MAG: hypothetical protein AB8G22_29510 [Saprospiraceae bacterium]